MTFLRFFQNFSENLGIKTFTKQKKNQKLPVLPPNLTAEILVVLQIRRFLFQFKMPKSFLLRRYDDFCDFFWKFSENSNYKIIR